MKDRRNTTPPIVSETLTLQLVDSAGGSALLDAEVRYDARDPYAVSTTFITGTGEVAWTFARDLLSAGLHQPSGDGDVHVRPSLDSEGRAILVVELRSPDGEATAHAKASEVSGFLQRIHDLVPPGTEHDHLDLDGTITSILATGAP